ncbi:MAG TPA: HigA family addiction module antitoxin [Burkholderiales bacterium]
MAKRLRNIHPGEVLLEEFLEPMGISQNALARATGVPPRRINEIVLGKRALTADTALRLAAFFGTSEGFWLGLQADYDLEETRLGMGKELLRVEQARAKYAVARKTATHNGRTS